MLDFDCVQVSYQKYLNSMKTLNEAVVDVGRANHSEYILQSVGSEPRDRFLDHVFPVGGHPGTQGAQGLPDLRRKFFEAYMYSDPLKVGR